MSPSTHIQLLSADPLAFIDAALLFLVQILRATHPELVATDDGDDDPQPPPPIRAARAILDAIRELHYAIEAYTVYLPSSPRNQQAANDDIPF
jgi:hypothetical protein